jgi:glycerol-3-phosphate acyltransferase PlsX
MTSVRVAVDAMGGDFAPEAILDGVAQAAGAWPDVEIHLFGSEEALSAVRGKAPAFVVHPTDQSIGMDESPAQALRQKPRASIRLAVEAVASGEADAVFSAGNTGALVAAATLSLRLLPGIRKTGIAATLPTRTGCFTLIDAGANILCKPMHLYHYALMASVFHQALFGQEHPAVGLLNIGEEDAKGNVLVKETAGLLKASPLIRYRGYVEGKEIFGGGHDVVVCEGFVGNTVLKTSEGLAEHLFAMIREALHSSWRARLGGGLVRPALRKLASRVDYAQYGAAMLLGVNGTCLIGHGRSNPWAVRNAVGLARKAVLQRINPRIVEGLKAFLVEEPAAGSSAPAEGPPRG